MPRPDRIDAHQHFWQISRGDYDWMTDEVAEIRRDILPVDISPLIAAHGIDGTVVVQAAATVAETEFLIGLAAENSFIKGVIGWVDLDDPSAPEVLAALSQVSVFKGIRPMLQDISDTGWIARPNVIANLAEAARMGLRLDALVTQRHIDLLAQVAAQLPTLPIVIDHCAKPLIAGGAYPSDAWRSGMTRLAALPNLFCKISGLANEAGPEWDARRLQPVVDHVLTQFGPDRVMWGSDWPVLNLAGNYARWRAVSNQMLSGLSVAECDDIYGGTAIRFYGLENSQ